MEDGRRICLPATCKLRKWKSLTSLPSSARQQPREVQALWFPQPISLSTPPPPPRWNEIRPHFDQAAPEHSQQKKPRYISGKIGRHARELTFCLVSQVHTSVPLPSAVAAGECVWCGPSRQATPVVDQNREIQSTLTIPLATVLGPPENPSPLSLVHEPERGPSTGRLCLFLSALSTLTVFRPASVRYPGPRALDNLASRPACHRNNQTKKLSFSGALPSAPECGCGCRCADPVERRSDRIAMEQIAMGLWATASQSASWP